MLGFSALAKRSIGHSPVTGGGPITPGVLEDSWHQPFSIPAQRLRPIPIANYQFASMSQQYATFLEDTQQANKWLVPFSEPTRFRRRLATHHQQFAAFVQFAPFYETVSIDRWQQPLSQPTMIRSRLATDAQQFGAFVKAAPFEETIVVTSWFVPFSEPIRFRRRLDTSAQQFEASLGLPLSGADSYRVTLRGRGLLTAVITSPHKEMLKQTTKRFIYTAEIHPWSVSDRNT